MRRRPRFSGELKPLQMRLAILTSHPIQYNAPLFRAIAGRIDLTVWFAHKATPEQQADAGFGTAFDWDVDLLDGFPYEFLRNVSRNPGTHHFAGCDTPQIAEKLRAGGFDALLVTGWHLKSYWQGIWAGKRCCIPVLVRGDSHLDTPRSVAKRLAKRAVYPAFLRLFDAALYVGKRNRDYYEHYRYPAERLFHSPHCVDTARFATNATPAARSALRRQLGLGPDEKAILFAGKLVSIKRPLDVVEAAAAVRSQGLPVQVIVAGSGPLEPQLQSRASAMGVPLHVLGFQNQTQMPAAYAAADVLVLPSSHETWGLVCNEALACGKPIVVSDAVGCAPDLAEGVVGRVFPTGNIEAFAAAIMATLQAPPSANSISQISERHSPASAAAGIVAAVEALAKRRAPAGFPLTMARPPLAPTITQRILRAVGRLPIPRVEGLLSRLGVLRSSVPHQFVVRFSGLRYQGSLGQHVDRHIYYLGAYARAELDFLGHAASILRGPRGRLTFVDVGANVGQHSLFMAGRADRIVAFDPNPEVADRLDANVRLNGLHNVEVLRYALGRKDEVGELGSGLDGNSGSRSLTWSLDASKNTTVEIRDADQAMAELDIQRVDLLKIDVEGYEKNVLMGLSGTLRRDRPIILFELVGSDMKGGFQSEGELRETLYGNHCLFTLAGTRKARLVGFDWRCEEAVCIPSELAPQFAALMALRSRQ